MHRSPPIPSLILGLKLSLEGKMSTVYLATLAQTVWQREAQECESKMYRGWQWLMCKPFHAL